jgi:diaminopimelate decarboxylase
MNDAIERLDECLSIRDGELFIEGCRTVELARRFGTPLYVVSEDQLRRNARRLESAFASRWPGELLLLPSIKANSSLALRRILTDEGTGCDVFGPGELEAALRAGTGPERVSLNGPMKDEALLERAIREGVRITLDSRAELRSACGFGPTLSGLTRPRRCLPTGLRSAMPSSATRRAFRPRTSSRSAPPRSRTPTSS